jgi:hypothetical protein
MAVDSIQLPVHGSTATEILKHDHQAVARLLTTFMRATTLDERSDALTYLKAALVIHNATEENIIYPALGSVVAHAALEENAAFADLEAHANAREMPALTSSVREFRGSFQFSPSP